jgi:chromosome segregation ATPase
MRVFVEQCTTNAHVAHAESSGAAAARLREERDDLRTRERELQAKLEEQDAQLEAARQFGVALLEQVEQADEEREMLIEQVDEERWGREEAEACRDTLWEVTPLPLTPHLLCTPPPLPEVPAPARLR